MIFNDLIYAINLNNVKLNENVDINNNVSVNQNVQNLPLELNVNYVDITEQNAWRILNTWTWKNNFRTKINLTWWVYFELNNDWLTRAFSWTNKLKQKFQEIKWRWLDIWSFELEDIKMNQYPDRIEIVQKSKVVISNKTQFDNYKNNIWSLFNYTW
jgi:hypothetical protein